MPYTDEEQRARDAAYQRELERFDAETHPNWGTEAREAIGEK